MAVGRLISTSLLRDRESETFLLTFGNERPHHAFTLELKRCGTPDEVAQSLRDMAMLICDCRDNTAEES